LMHQTAEYNASHRLEIKRLIADSFSFYVYFVPALTGTLINGQRPVPAALG